MFNVAQANYIFRLHFEDVYEIKSEIFKKIECKEYSCNDESLAYSIENNPNWQDLIYMTPDDLGDRIWFCDVGENQNELITFKTQASDIFLETIGNSIYYRLKFYIYFPSDSSNYSLFKPFPGSTIKGVCIPRFEISNIERQLSQSIEPLSSIITVGIELSLIEMSSVLFIPDEIIP